jgi:hypothetical protein
MPMFRPLVARASAAMRTRRSASGNGSGRIRGENGDRGESRRGDDASQTVAQIAQK